MKIRWLVLCVTVLGLFITRGILDLDQASAQFDVFKNSDCVPFIGVSCPDCDAAGAPEFGCANPYPNTWTVGTCDDGSHECTQWMAFDCGRVVNCVLGTPEQSPCGFFWLCQQ